MNGIAIKDFTPLKFSLGKAEAMNHKIEVWQVNKKLALLYTLHKLSIIKLHTVCVENDRIFLRYE